MPEALATVVGLGSNVAPEHHLPRAVARLRERLPLAAVSSVWRTVAVGPAGQAPFLNAAVLVYAAAPHPLKAMLREIEAALGRVRTADRFAPRTIDLDLVLHGEAELTVDGTPLPDPELLHEPHLAVPAAEVLPEWIHPQSGETLRAIAARLGRELGAERQPQRLPLSLAPPSA